jgi:hypothetical protein
MSRPLRHDPFIEMFAGAGQHCRSDVESPRRSHLDSIFRREIKSLRRRVTPPVIPSPFLRAPTCGA